jgi:type IV pilus biogenesis protein CpaD/CtpE
MDEDLPEPPGVLNGLTNEERVEEFLRMLGEGVKVRNAATACALHWSNLYKRRGKDPVFAKRWEDAQRVKVGHLIQEAERRAMVGSDKLLMFLLTNYAPDKFKKASALEITNPDGSLNMSTEERAARTIAILEKARAAKAAKAAASNVDDLL